MSKTIPITKKQINSIKGFATQLNLTEFELESIILKMTNLRIRKYNSLYCHEAYSVIYSLKETCIKNELVSEIIPLALDLGILSYPIDSLSFLKIVADFTKEKFPGYPSQLFSVFTLTYFKNCLKHEIKVRNEIEAKKIQKSILLELGIKVQREKRIPNKKVTPINNHKIKKNGTRK